MPRMYARSTWEEEYITIKKCKICGRAFFSRGHFDKRLAELTTLVKLLNHVEQYHPDEKKYIEQIKNKIRKIHDELYSEIDPTPV